MRDAFGGIVNITMIVVFLVIVSGYLAFNVTYTKAFRMKNKIITTLEQYQGVCEDECMGIIERYATRIGYNLGIDRDATPDVVFGGDAKELYTNTRGYSWARYDVGTTDNPKSYFKVATKIVIEIPIIENIMENMDAFTLTGNTKLITIPETE